MEKKYSMERAINKLKHLYDKRTEPESIYETLKAIVDGYALKQDVSSDLKAVRTARNKGVEDIVEHLNKLQKELAFQDEYEVTYKKKSVRNLPP